MNVLMVLRNLMRKFGINSNFLLSMSRKEQEDFISTLPQAENDVSRSINQYRCTMFIMGKFACITSQLASLFLLPCYRYSLLKRKTAFIQQADAVFFSGQMPVTIIPSSVRQEFPKIIRSEVGMYLSLDKEDKEFLKTLYRDHILSPYYKFKVLLKTGMYSAVLKMYQPKAIITYTEYSFTSQIMTSYLESKGILHINVMHGEKLYNITDSYARFSRYYVWDEYYKRLMVRLNAEAEQFIVEAPVSLKEELERKPTYLYFLTYYLAEEKEGELVKIKDFFEQLKASGHICKIRLHPRSYDQQQIEKIFAGYKIEYPEDIPLKESLEETAFVCSLASTVLYEAWYKGKPVVIDDVTRPDYYEKLKELDYIMLNKPHMKLSVILNAEFLHSKEVS